jgi:hypothetical protein
VCLDPEQQAAALQVHAVQEEVVEGVLGAGAAGDGEAAGFAAQADEEGSRRLGLRWARERGSAQPLIEN